MPDSKSNNDDFIDLVPELDDASEPDPAAVRGDVPDFVDLVHDVSSDDLSQGDFTVTVNKTGDVVWSIDIECQCGKKTRILLEYDE